MIPGPKPSTRPRPPAQATRCRAPRARRRSLPTRCCRCSASPTVWRRVAHRAGRGTAAPRRRWRDHQGGRPRRRERRPGVAAEVADEAGKCRSQQRGESAREDHAEAVVGELVAERTVVSGTRTLRTRPMLEARRGSAAASLEHGRPGSVTEHQRAQQVVDGAVAGAEGERRQLDRDDQRSLVRGACAPNRQRAPGRRSHQHSRAGRWAAARRRDAVPARDEMGIEAGQDETGAGGHHQEPDGLAADVRRGERPLGRRHGELGAARAYRAVCSPSDSASTISVGPRTR